MKTSGILFIFAFALIVLLPVSAQAGPVGTSFTYQGRLIDNNQPADGQYDFQFKLYDSESDGNQIGEDVNAPETQVNDGYFTVELDFGSVFDGNDRWLEIGVRPGEVNDPNEYTALSPRQKVTPTPYALYAKAAGSSVNVDSDWIISGNDMYSGVSGNVGIGTASPQSKLQVAGGMQVGGDSGACGAAKAGTLRYNGGKIEYCNGNEWQAVGGGEISFSVIRDDSYDWPANNTEQAIDFTTFLFMYGNCFNMSTDTFTAPVSGTYTFHGTIFFNYLSPGDLIYACILVNGTYRYVGDYLRSSGTYQSINVSITRHLEPGDTVKLCGFVNAPAPPAQVRGSTSNYAFTHFEGARVF